jgi:hypothetical protein
MISKSPTAIQIAQTMFPSISNLSINQLGSGLSRVSKKGANAKEVKLLNDQFKSTNIQPIIQAAKDTIVKQKGLARTGVGSGSLYKLLKRENVGYNASHEWLAALEPGAALLNAIKRGASMERKVIKDSDPIVIKKLKNAANLINTGLDVAAMKIPMLQAQAKGLVGIAFKESRGTKLNQIFGSPAIKASIEDSQRFAHIANTLAKHNVPKIKGETLDNPLLHKVKALADASKEKVDRYGDGVKGIGLMVKDTVATAKDAAKDSKQGLGKNILKSLSPNKSVREEGEAGLKAIGKTVAVKANKAAVNKLKDADKGFAMATDEAADFENKYNRWALPGTALGAVALASPMAKDMYDRNRQSKDTASPILHGKQVA